jgi:hypothetical protein
VLTDVILEEDMRQKILLIARGKLEEASNLAHDEFQRILADEKRQPITYINYYTDNIRKARGDSLKDAIQKAVRGAVDEDFKGKLHVSNTQLDSEKLFASLSRRVVVDMDAQACAEAVGGLHAYYKVSMLLELRSWLTDDQVALKLFVDNICRQVIERHLPANLPEIFAPTTVMNFSNEDLEHIAAEPVRQKARRVALVTLAQGLQDSLAELRN